MVRTTWIRSLAAGAAFCLAAALADAAHFTPHLDGLEGAVAARIAAIGTPGPGPLRTELGHLQAMQKALSKTTTKLSTDLGALSAALGRYRKIAAPDAGVATAVTTALGALRDEADALVGTVGPDVQAYEADGGKKSVAKSLKKLIGSAEKAMEKAAIATDPSKRASLLRSAAASLEKARALLDKQLCAGGGSITCLANGTPVVHGAYEGAYAIRRKLANGTLVNLYIRPTGPAGHVDLFFEAHQVAPGTYPATAVARYFEGTKQYDPTSGTVTITAVDLDREFIAGTFEFVAAEFFEPTDTRTITSGKFTVCKFNEQVLSDF